MRWLLAYRENASDGCASAESGFPTAARESAPAVAARTSPMERVFAAAAANDRDKGFSHSAGRLRANQRQSLRRDREGRWADARRGVRRDRGSGARGGREERSPVVHFLR